VAIPREMPKVDSPYVKQVIHDPIADNSEQSHSPFHMDGSADRHA
jgi:hypothetical protein